MTLPYVLFFDQVDRSHLFQVGGKGANLGELTQNGFPVPSGFCITTEAYKDFLATSTKIEQLLAELNDIDVKDQTQLSQAGERIRRHLQQLTMPLPIREEITEAINQQGSRKAYAIRSSATAEDLPNASFAGQQDTYLNIKGQDDLLAHVQKCWASLFTDRAIAYRAKNGFDHRSVYLSIVVQQMIIPEVSGILFTADPLNGNRMVVSIDAGFGLGEALVSGMVSADLYKVREGKILDKKIAQKTLAVVSLPDGGTVTTELEPDQQMAQALTDEQIITLAALGKKIEEHYQVPQDIEFCLAQGEFFIVQSRPITTLYPLPDLSPQPHRVLLSFGHVQMMPDAMKPLGLSVLRTVFPRQVFVEAGSRIFIDVTDFLHSPIVRTLFPKVLTAADEAMSRALTAVLKRPDFFKGNRRSAITGTAAKIAASIVKKAWRLLRTGDPRLAGPAIESYMEQQVEQARKAINGAQGAERLKTVQRQLDGVIMDVLTTIMPFVVPGIIAGKVLERLLIRWLGDAQELASLNKALPGNVTSEMGLQLGDLADMLRDLPEVREYLQTAADPTFYTGLSQAQGGAMFKQQFEQFIGRYGMRCPGEIDLTRPRWREKPTLLLAAIFSHMQSVKQGEHRQRFAEGQKEADEAAVRILSKLRTNPLRLKLASRLIVVFRYMGGLREHHKFFIIRILDECKAAIMAQAKELEKAGKLAAAEDAYFLSLEELIELAAGEGPGTPGDTISKRKAEFERNQNLKPPRVFTSEGEIINVPPANGDIPEGMLLGSPVSAGIAEGVARVILKPENAALTEGQILVAPQTDPGWTPLFQSAVAIVTEVGGLMTHGAVVAREYGIPAVAGVDDATIRIKDGERIRVNGDRGTVEILSEIGE
ncbi:pyruvate,water dikinase [Anaerospora hongkongensis]|uniref:Pyruvate,water dikinase n=2 Tax=Anaerospora hongkongensis TaxID=244830 RepID=A0A4R1Q0P9_9FIRM|nr:phosphoenolpyruvate synthase [Anaerospora hongkongensis]TCL36893.1 pyruvate,water dikinase [Anaerospora hongkongensis]